jgi:hypothetical protein
MAKSLKQIKNVQVLIALKFMMTSSLVTLERGEIKLIFILVQYNTSPFCHQALTHKAKAVTRIFSKFETEE